MSIDFNPLAPAVIANPLPHYKELRDKAPVVWMEALQAWAVSRYADVEFALRNPQLFSSSLFTEQALGDLNHVPEVPWLLDMNPPAHTRLRKLANKGFLKRRIRALEPHVKAIATRLVGDLRECSETDLVASFSGPLPTIVIAEMLGVDPERRADFKNWSDDVVVATARPTDPAERARVRASLSEFRVYLEGMIEERRTNPAEDLISALVHAKEENDTLSSSEVLALTSLLLVAGNETTTNLIGSMIRLLSRYPDQMRKVVADRNLLPGLIEISSQQRGRPGPGRDPEHQRARVAGARPQRPRRPQHLHPEVTDLLDLGGRRPLLHPGGLAPGRGEKPGKAGIPCGSGRQPQALHGDPGQHRGQAAISQG